MVFIGLSISKVSAQDVSSSISVEITTPSSVEVYPGVEGAITANVTNNTSSDMTNLIVYITMVDVVKNMTVNLEDYSADVPVVIPELKANQSETVTLPIIYVYPSEYHLYVTVATKDNLDIISSPSIPVNIITLTKIDYPLVKITSIAVPVLLLLAFGFVSIQRKRRNMTIQK